MKDTNYREMSDMITLCRLCHKTIRKEFKKHLHAKHPEIDVIIYDIIQELYYDGKNNVIGEVIG